VSDSFLAQLEQRTQQVKITLANLEAEKVRIEAQISALQPVVPHYDQLLAAERSLNEAQVRLDEAAPAVPRELSSSPNGGSDAENNWESQHQAPAQDTWA
jgi:hypothetical protein